MAHENQQPIQADGDVGEEWGKSSFVVREPLRALPFGERAVCRVCNGQDQDCADCASTGLELTRDDWLAIAAGDTGAA